MGLTNIIRNTTYALATSLALAGAVYETAYSAEPAKPRQTEVSRNPWQRKEYSPRLEMVYTPNLEDFIGLIEHVKGNKLGEKQRERTKLCWERDYTFEKKALLFDIYNNPEKVLKSFSDKERKEFDEFFKNYKGMRDYLSAKITPVVGKKITGELLDEGEKTIKKSYEIEFPWIINLDNPKLSDKLVIYLEEKESAELKKELERK